MMKHRHLIPILLLTFCLLAAPAAAAGGAGTAANPYVIQTPAELQSIQNDLSAHYILGNDIDMTSVENWVPIGSSSAPFFGSLDGNGHTIHNFTASFSTAYAGLFGVILSSAEIKDLSLKDCSVSVSEIGCGILIGAIASASSAASSPVTEILVDNCSIDSTNQQVGLIIGRSTVNGEISHCHVRDSFVSGRVATGGILGNIAYLNTNITSCSVVDTVINSTGHSIGSIVGRVEYNSDAFIINSSALNCVISGPNWVGGIAGRSVDDGSMVGVISSTVRNCSILGTLSSSDVGGVIGIVSVPAQAFVEACQVEDSTIIGGNTAAGICPSFG